jgi:hypothetical protein
MTPREVQGLQSLAMANGGSLTVNPDTGLPEAGFLSSILPMVAGAALTATGIGAPLAAGIIGGGTALLTGNLQKGLMAGLGAYGGAGLGQGLMGMGATAVSPAALQAANASADPIMALTAAKDAATAAGTAAPTGFEAIKSGISQAAQDPGAFVDALGGGKKAMQYGLAAAAPMMAGQMVPTTTQMPAGGPNPYQYSYNAGRVADPEAGYTGATTGERTYFQPTFTRLAKGGVADLARGGFVVPADVVSMLGEGSTDAGIRALRSQFGGAVKAIKGPGTGQSDSIATSIEGEQPARVADGEAYVPPEVVAKHGGAEKFYAMLDRVRAASQGHTKQQRRINPERVMA